MLSYYKIVKTRYAAIKNVQFFLGLILVLFGTLFGTDHLSNRYIFLIYTPPKKKSNVRKLQWLCWRSRRHTVMLILKSVCFQFKVIQLAGHEVNGDLEGASSQSLAEGATVHAAEIWYVHFV